MAVKYTVTHKGYVAGQEVPLKIELHEDGFSGTATEIKGDAGSGVFEHDYERLTAQKPFDKPIQKSSLTLHFVIQSDSDLTILTDIINAGEDKYQLVKKVSGSEVWRGKVLPDMVEYAERDYPITGSVTAKDLSSLEGYSYGLKDTQPTLITAIADIVNGLGYGLDIHTYTNWRNQNDQSDDYLNIIHINTFNLRNYAQADGEEDTAFTDFKALEELLRANNLILRQANNAWHLYHISALQNPTTVQRYVYDSTGTQQSSGTVDLTHTVNNADSFILPNSINQHLRPAKSTRRRFDHRTLVYGFDLPSRVILEQGDPAVTYGQDFNPDGNQTIEYSGQVRLIEDDGSASDAEVDLVLRSGSYYWDGEQWLNQVVNFTVQCQQNINDTFYGSFSFETSAVPDVADGQLAVQFLSGTTSAGTADRSEFRELQFSVNNPSVEDGNNVAIITEIEQTGIWSSRYDYGDVLFGDGPTSYSPARLMYDSSGTLLATEDGEWGFVVGDNTTSDKGFQELACKEIINFQRNPIRNLQGLLKADYSPHEVVSYDNNNYFFLGGVQTGYDVEWNGFLLKLDVSDDASDTVTTFYETSGGGTSGTASGDTSGGGTFDPEIYDSRWFNIDQALGELANADIDTALANLGLKDGNRDLNLNGLTAPSITHNDFTHQDGAAASIFNAGDSTDEWVWRDSSGTDIFSIKSGGTIRALSDTDGLIVGGNDDSPRLAAARDAAPGSLTIQPTGNNRTGSAELYPHGTNERSHFVVANSSDTNNNGAIKLELDGEQASLWAYTKGTGGVKPTHFIFRDFNEGVRFEDSVIVGSNNIPSSLFHIDHSGDDISAIQVGDQSTPSNSTGIYLRSTSEAYLRSADLATLKFGTPSADTLHITSGGDINQPNFSHGWQGTDAQIDADGNIEAESLFLRGGLTAFEAIINRVRYNFGDSVLSAGGGKIGTVVDATVGSEKVIFEDPEGNEVLPVAEGDLVMLQSWDLDRTTIIKRIWRRVNAIVDDGTGSIIQVNFAKDGDMPSDSGVVAEGDEFVVNGNDGTTANRDAIIYSSVTQTDTPFIKIQDNINSYTDWTSSGTTKALVGDLTDAPDLADGTTPTGNGFFAKGNAYFDGHMVANTGKIMDYITIGDNTYIGDHTSRFVGAGNMLIGNYNDGANPLVRAFGTSLNDFVWLRPAASSGLEIFRIDRGGNTIVGVSEDSAQFFGAFVDDTGLWAGGGATSNPATKSDSNIWFDFANGVIQYDAMYQVIYAAESVAAFGNNNEAGSIFDDSWDYTFTGTSNPTYKTLEKRYIRRNGINTVTLDGFFEVTSLGGNGVSASIRLSAGGNLDTHTISSVTGETFHLECDVSSTDNIEVVVEVSADVGGTSASDTVAASLREDIIILGTT